MLLHYFLLILSFFGFMHFGFSDDILVTLPNGVISGSQEQSYSGNVYCNFQKIPYAAPPVGNLRFKAPVPSDNWHNILNTTSLDVVCYQLRYQKRSETTRQSEDCLYVNVFTPELPTQTNSVSIPVLLYIHGDDFIQGDAMTYNLGPEYLIDYGVVIVTFNYRLGPFGFLSTGDTVIPGNNGLKDQHLAIQWVHDNIHLFGGDPDKITIVGESAGGASVGYQLLNPKSEGLFRAAMMESGTPIHWWAVERSPREPAFALATLLNNSFSDVNDSEVLLQYLLSVPAEDLSLASRLVAGWAPVIEVEHDGAFISGKMYRLVRTGNFVRKPILMGINSEQAIHIAAELEYLGAMAENNDNNLPQLLPPDMNLLVNEENKEHFGKAIRRIYCGNGTFADNFPGLVRYTSDNLYSRSAMRCAELMSKFTPVFFYQFSYDGPMGGVNISNIEGAESVGHAEELRYLWRTAMFRYDNSDLSKFPVEDVLTQRRMLTLWTNFVKFLNPTPEAVELLQNVMWPTVTSETPLDFLYLDIGTDLEVKNHLKGQAYLGWIELFGMLGTDDFETF